MTTRRDFLKQMGVAAAGLGIAPISSLAAGHSNNIAAPKGDKVKIAFIGIGNRGEQDVRNDSAQRIARHIGRSGHRIQMVRQHAAGRSDGLVRQRRRSPRRKIQLHLHNEVIFPSVGSINTAGQVFPGFSFFPKKSPQQKSNSITFSERADFRINRQEDLPR